MASNYHLMRNFVALMQLLGYPRLISIENFRNPNFPLMADVLVYLLKRFDPDIEIEANIETETERLKFVMSASYLMVNKANLDINIKKLYMADINSVQEMIKLAKLIQDAWNSLDVKNKEDEGIEEQSTTIEMSNNLTNTTLSEFNNFKTSQITSDIYEVATKLYDTIAEYDQNKDQLQKTISKQLVIDQIESSVRKSIQQMQQEIIDMQNKKQNLDRDNEDLNGKIEKKLIDLNRNKKRLQTLYAQRPGYMDELEKIEQDIIGLYDQYVTNSRCLFFLEQKLEEFEELERLKIEQRNKEIKQMLEQIKIDDFLKCNKDMRLDSWTTNHEERSINDELALIVDIDEDAQGRVSGSDLSDKDINEISRNESRKERKMNLNLNQKKRSGKNDRLLMANTVTIKSQRSPVNLKSDLRLNEKQLTDSNTNRSAKTARIFSYGSLLENDEEDDSKSETNARMSDSEIDLDAIDSEDSINSTEMDFKSGMSQNENSIKLSNFNYGKVDDNF